MLEGGRNERRGEGEGVGSKMGEGEGERQVDGGEEEKTEWRNSTPFCSS